ncbi:MAG TPA: hypothetical protein VGF80_09400 [Galbitalea sp.]|jgi:hypothetical protein
MLGTWEVTIDTPMGSQVVSLDFTDEHTGVARYGNDSAPLQDVSVSADTATCSVRLTAPIAVTLKCAVTVDGDTLRGTASAGFFGKFSLAGRRTGGGR